MNHPTDSDASFSGHARHLTRSAAARKSTRRRGNAFSLVEVVLALGVTSFVLMALLGTLPEGLKTVKDSMNDSARANIMQEVRGELEELTFGNSATAADNIDSTLAGQTNYYSPEGLLLSTNSATVPTGAYYQVSFAASNATIPSTNSGTTFFQYESAQSVQVIMAYPVTAPTVNQTQSTNFLFTAKQKNY